MLLLIDLGVNVIVRREEWGLSLMAEALTAWFVSVTIYFPGRMLERIRERREDFGQRSIPRGLGSLF